MTLPPLKIGPDNLPYPQYYNTTISDYEGVQGSGGASFVKVANTSPIDINVTNTQIKVDLATSDIILPSEIRSTTKTYMYGTNTALSGNAVYTSSTVDCGLVKRLCGHVSADQSGTLYVQQSDDGSTNWLTISTTNISASSSTVINSVTYYSGITYDVQVTSRYARVVLVNGATAQTRLVLSGYTSSL